MTAQTEYNRLEHTSGIGCCNYRDVNPKTVISGGFLILGRFGLDIADLGPNWCLWWVLRSGRCSQGH